MAPSMIRCPFCGFDYPASKLACPWDSTPNRRGGSGTNNRPGEDTAWEGDGLDEAFDRAAAWVHDLVDNDEDLDVEVYCPFHHHNQELDGDGRKPRKGDGDNDEDMGRPRIHELSAEGGVETVRIYELSADGEVGAGKGGHTGGAAKAEAASSERKGHACHLRAAKKKDGQARQPRKLDDFQAARARLRQLASGEASASGRTASSSRRPQMQILRTGGDQEPFLWDTEGEMGDAEDWSWTPGAVGDVGGSSGDVTLVCSVKFSHRG